MKPALKRALRMFTAVTFLGIYLMGIPWLLLQVSLGEAWRQIRTAPGDLLRGQSTDEILLGFFALAAWICWFLFLRVLLSEGWGALRGRPLRDRDRTWPRQLAGMLMSSFFVGSSLIPATAPPLSSVFGTSSQVMNVSMSLLSTAGADEVSSIEESATPHPASATHVVKRRDTLWGLAERYLGDGMRWHEFYSLNKGIRQADGRHLDDPSLILVGWQLRVPRSPADEAVPTGIVRSEPTDMVSASESLTAIERAETGFLQLRSDTALADDKTDEQPEEVDQPLVSVETVPGPGDPDLLWIEPLDSSPDNKVDREFGVGTSGVSGFVTGAGSLIALGLGLSLDRLRRARRRSYSADLGPQRLEHRLSQLVGEVAGHTAPVGVASFWTAMRERGFHIVSGHLRAEEIAILLLDVASMAPPWRRRADGWWVAPRSSVLGDTDADWPELVVEVGRSEQHLLVDLEAVSSLRLVGDEQARTEALVQQLRDSPSGWSPELIFVGEYGSLCRAGERKAV
ncbi:MAG: LysM peptidoglycan-binding domain-containing protein, partial [Acidimicrobiales bacterium]